MNRSYSSTDDDATESETASTAAVPSELDPARKRDSDDQEGGANTDWCAEHLLAHHLAQLRQSGLAEATIVAAQLWSIRDTTEAAHYLNWSCGGPVPSLGFPCRDISGEIVAFELRPDTPVVRDDGHAPKYEWPTNTPTRLGFAPPGLIGRKQYEDQAVPLLLTEGAKKLLAAAQNGIGMLAPIASQGVTRWHDVAHKKDTGEWRLHPDFDSVPLDGRIVHIAFDSDVSDNINVIHAEARLARMLVNKGASVRLIRFPPRGA